MESDSAIGIAIVLGIVLIFGGLFWLINAGEKREHEIAMRRFEIMIKGATAEGNSSNNDHDEDEEPFVQ